MLNNEALETLNNNVVSIETRKMPVTANGLVAFEQSIAKVSYDLAKSKQSVISMLDKVPDNPEFLHILYEITRLEGANQKTGLELHKWKNDCVQLIDECAAQDDELRRNIMSLAKTKNKRLRG